MFEKEAEDNKPPYAFCTLNTNCELWKDGFQKGAELGYNKGYHDAEEHYLNVIDSQHKLVDESRKKDFKKCMKCTDGTYQYGFKDGYNKAKEELRGKHNVDWRKIKKTTKGVEQDNSEEIKYRNSNLNFYIKIKLTEEGRIIYKKHYAKYNCEAPKLNIDNEGYVQFQIHDFMHIFGEHLFMGATLPCETYCKIQVSSM